MVIPPEVLLNAYAEGVFPMADEGEILWFSPKRRGLIPLDERFHIPHGLKRALRRKPFELRWNTAFRNVMLGCADRQECWDGDGLQGGRYGVEVPGVFFGERMFSRKTDASKIALVELVERLRERGFRLLDTQWLTPHLKTFGGYEVPRAEYLKMLQSTLKTGTAAALKLCEA